MPKRIQLRRTKGWRKPEGAVSVARPTKWGNPFVVGGFYWDRLFVHNCPFPLVSGEIPVFMLVGEGLGETVACHCNPVRDRAQAVKLFRNYVAYNNDVWTPEVLRSLRDKDLACWCPPDMPCHADVLLELANGETP